MKTALHLQDADGFYEQLLDAHLGLTPEQSQLLNARLILLLANQVGDATVLKECIEAAKQLPEISRAGCQPSALGCDLPASRSLPEGAS